MIGIEMRAQLRYAVVVEPLDERLDGRAHGVGLEETVILQTLEHDELVPVFPDEIELLGA